MCGISGYIGRKHLEKSLIQKTLNAMKNRGPDHQDYKQLLLGSNNLYLLSNIIIRFDKILNLHK